VKQFHQGLGTQTVASLTNGSIGRLLVVAVQPSQTETLYHLGQHFLNVLLGEQTHSDDQQDANPGREFPLTTFSGVRIVEYLVYLLCWNNLLEGIQHYRIFKSGLRFWHSQNDRLHRNSRSFRFAGNFTGIQLFWRMEHVASLN